MSLIVNAVLGRMAVTYKPDPKAADKSYDFLSMWQTVGHNKDTPVLSSHVRGWEVQMNATSTFLKQITALVQTTSMVFEAVDCKAYYQYLCVFHHQLGLTALDVLHTA